MKKHFLLSVLMLLPLVANAAVEYNGLWYNLNSNNNTAEVVASQGAHYSGNISIASSVYYQSNSYNVISIGTSAFEGCTSLSSIYIPNGVMTIGASAFEGCIGLSSINIPNSVTTISSGAFWSCTGLKIIEIPEGVTTIAETAFNKCSNLSTIVIPNSVKSIGSNAFANCPNLIQIFSRIQNPFAINQNVFGVYSTATLYIPKGTKASYQSKSGWKKFTNINDGTTDNQTKRSIHVLIAGTLSYYIAEEDKYQIEELTLTGEINGDDLGFIREMAGCKNAFDEDDVDRGSGYIKTSGKLSVLDLSNVSIVAGGCYLVIFDAMGWGSGYYLLKDNVLPEQVFWKCGSLNNVVLPNNLTSSL